jgi:hypothetical protein
VQKSEWHVRGAVFSLLRWSMAFAAIALVVWFGITEPALVAPCGDMSQEQTARRNLAEHRSHLQGGATGCKNVLHQPIPLYHV